MKRNPFLKADKAVIKKVYGNPAVLKMCENRRSYDSHTGEFTEDDAVFLRNIFIGNMHEIADAVVDGKQYVKGDLHTEVAFQEIADSLVPMTGDPVIVIDKEQKTIADLRKADHRTAGIKETKDSLVFDGTEYRIIRITPMIVYAGVPSKLKIQLRSV